LPLPTVTTTCLRPIQLQPTATTTRRSLPPAIILFINIAIVCRCCCLKLLAVVGGALSSFGNQRNIKQQQQGWLEANDTLKYILAGNAAEHICNKNPTTTTPSQIAYKTVVLFFSFVVPPLDQFHYRLP
jgi:hypothetical protein